MLARVLGLDLDVVTLRWWRQGIEVELEHGRVCSLTNVTGDTLLPTAKIALAHLIELPDYYQRLQRMEAQGDRFWARKRGGKPDIFVATRNPHCDIR